MSKVVKDLCNLWDIQHIRTSPYHPQSDGALERWHACLKGMIKKKSIDKSMWDELVKFCLFAYRDTPHCVTGYPPFELMFGRDIKGPLELMRSSWVEGKVDGMRLCDWVKEIRQKMCAMAEVVREKEVIAKGDMKWIYDRRAKEVEFKEGGLVLVHKPGIACKMDGAWDGPFQVKRQISPVNVEVILPGKTKPKVLHANLIKPYFAPTSVVHRVAVIREEDDDTVMDQGRMILTDGGRPPTEQEKLQLAGVLDKHRDNLCKEPGCTKEIMMSILLEDSRPFALRPYTTPNL